MIVCFHGCIRFFASEIEDFLYTHEAVQDVQVVGVPSDKFGEELCACIILKAGHTATAELVRVGTVLSSLAVCWLPRSCGVNPVTVPSTSISVALCRYHRNHTTDSRVLQGQDRTL